VRVFLASSERGDSRPRTCDSRGHFSTRRRASIHGAQLIGPGDLWYKDAVIYAINVETFQDSDGDGIGDFPGLTSRVDYLHALGITCVWLLPFHPSPNRDNRYDVADYYDVDPRLGSLGDFVDFLRAARERGIRVMIDLVVNHTSDQHPWFQAARTDRGSRYHDYYVWADTPPLDAGKGMMFPGVETSTWSLDEASGRWYFHRFYRHQPDLNLGNPAVREEIRKIMGFWLELGVSGFRVDAAPFLIERKGIQPADVEARRPHTFFRYMRGFLSWRRGDAALLAEANILPAEVSDYVGTGDRLHMLFNFHSNQRVFLALATGRAEPLATAMRQLPALPLSAQWANFLRNHDELDLSGLSDEERRVVFGAFAPDPGMQIYERGIRRRLAPMLDNDRRRLELAHSILLALPGTPVIRYGDEIGMGEDLTLDERFSVRTPMQWTNGRHGGFSTAPAQAVLVRPMICEGEYGTGTVNVADQQRDPTSLLSWMQRAIGIRRGCPELSWGSSCVLDVAEPSVLALCSATPERAIFCLHNLAGDRRDVRVDFGLGDGDQMTELFSDSEYPPASDGHVALAPFGYRWLRVTRGGGPRG
jgi:maltose alpha-D-glucosyltransferase/alpha-amylase